ncbi:unnamed protein product [Tilletia caries]|nr:unnamed protein product [Tilletia caries]
MSSARVRPAQQPWPQQRPPPRRRSGRILWDSKRKNYTPSSTATCTRLLHHHVLSPTPMSPRSTRPPQQAQTPPSSRAPTTNPPPTDTAPPTSPPQPSPNALHTQSEQTTHETEQASPFHHAHAAHRLTVLAYILCVSYFRLQLTTRLGDYDIPEDLSDDARDLIRSILKQNPVERLGIRAILSHPWFTRHPMPPLPSLSSFGTSGAESADHNHPPSSYRHPHLSNSAPPSDGGSEVLRERESENRESERSKRRSASSIALSVEGILPPHSASAASATRFVDYVSLLTQLRPTLFSTLVEQRLLFALSMVGVEVGQIVHSVTTDACDASGALLTDPMSPPPIPPKDPARHRTDSDHARAAAVATLVSIGSNEGLPKSAQDSFREHLNRLPGASGTAAMAALRQLERDRSLAAVSGVSSASVVGSQS